MGDGVTHSKPDLEPKPKPEVFGLSHTEIESLLKFLDLRITGSNHQHDDRAAGKFGSDRSRPENLAWWRGRVHGLQEAYDELVMRLDPRSRPARGHQRDPSPSYQIQ